MSEVVVAEKPDKLASFAVLPELVYDSVSLTYRAAIRPTLILKLTTESSLRRIAIRPTLISKLLAR